MSEPNVDGTDADAAGTSGSSAPARNDLEAWSSRGPVLDRLSIAVAITGFLLLATNDAPPLSEWGTITVASACFAVGAIGGLALFRLLGPLVLAPLWIGVGTAVFLWLPIVAGLLLTGYYTAVLGWAASLGAALFGLGVTARATRARLEYARSA